MNTSSAKTSRITYSTLKKHYAEHLERTEKQTQINNNYTTINTWLKANGLTEVSIIGRELNEDFKSKLEDYVTAQQLLGIKATTYRSRVSHLRALSKFYISKLVPSILPDTFSGALSHIVANSRFNSLKSLHQHLLSDVCSYEMLRVWALGKSSPSHKSLPIIKEIEKRCSLNPDALTLLLPKRLWGETSLIKTCQTSFGRKIAVARTKPYFFWSNKIELEWASVVDFMTAPYLPEGKSRNSVWTRSNEDSYFPSAEIGKHHLQAFFGYCCLSKNDDPFLNGPSMKSAQMTLAILTDTKLVERYLEFNKVRAGGIYTSAILTFISLVMQFLRPQTGYLYQHPQFGKKIDQNITKSKWEERCIRTRQRLKNIRDQLIQKGLIVKGRDPEEPIKEILTLDRPIYIPIITNDQRSTTAYAARESSQPS